MHPLYELILRSGKQAESNLMKSHESANIIVSLIDKSTNRQTSEITYGDIAFIKRHLSVSR